MDPSIAAPSGRSFARQLWCVVSEWLRNPSQVATICPSSPYLTQHLANRDCVRDADRVLELGPGTGGTTRALLSQMKPDSRLISIEKTVAFAEVLDEIRDPRLHVELGDACDLSGVARRHDFGKADVVLSGIPFSVLAPTDAKIIAQSVYDVLRPGGTFIAYQLKSDIEKYTLPLFGRARTESVAINLPPLQVFVWTRSIHDPEHTQTGNKNQVESLEQCAVE